MFTWILQISIISIIFIFLVHHIIYFLKSTLTVPKIKDLVNSPTMKYQDIFDTISNTNSNISSNFKRSHSKDNSYTDIDLLPTENDMSNSISGSSSDMKDELKLFLKKQLNTKGNSEEPEALGSGSFASF
jgi:cell shape-determining protein MreC